MKKVLIILAIALMGMYSINAQGVAATDTQFDNYSAVELSEIDGLAIVDESETTSSLEEGDMKFGVIGGLTSSTITGDEAESFDNRIGFHIGAMATKDISDEFAIHGELLYATMGSDYEQTFTILEANTNRRGGGDLTGTYKLDYLLLLIAAQYEVAQGLSLEAGPQFGVLLSAKDEFNIAGETGEEDVKDQTKGLDVGVSGGVGYTFDMGLYLKARYYLGLTEVNDFMFPGNESWKNGALFASVGFFIE